MSSQKIGYVENATGKVYYHQLLVKQCRNCFIIFSEKCEECDRIRNN